MQVIVFAFIILASWSVAHSVQVLMPRSTRAIRRRYLRAADRGFLVPHSQVGRRFVEAPSPLAPNLRCMAKGLEDHSRNNMISGGKFHNARDAAFAAKPKIGENHFKHSLLVNQSAGKAKHAPWSNFQATNALRDRWADCDVASCAWDEEVFFCHGCSSLSCLCDGTDVNT